MCKRGNASKEAAANVLKSEAFDGFKNVYTLDGGITAIQSEIDPSLPKY